MSTKVGHNSVAVKMGHKSVAPKMDCTKYIA